MGPRGALAFGPRLARFVGRLRARGIPVGLGEEIDLARALGAIDPLDRHDFYLACRTTLVKRPEDLPAFDEVFRAYWSPEAGAGEAGEALPSPSLLPRVAGDWGRRGRAFGGGDEEAEEGPAGGEALWGFLYSPDAPPGRRTLAPLDRREILALRHHVVRFRRWAATVEGRRFRPSRRGPVDFPRSARASLRSGGEWVALRRRRRRLQRTRLVVLWDVSSSMEGHHPRLVALLYGLLRAIPSTEVFAFSTDLQPVTAALRGRPYSRALVELSRRLLRARGGTQIGRALEAFRRRYGGLVDDRTVVLVLSDGWDLGDLDLLAAEAAALRRRCHLFLWVNPYADRPDFRPEVAGLRAALPYVDLLLPPSAFVRRELFARYFRRTPPGGPRGPSGRGSPATPSPG